MVRELSKLDPVHEKMPHSNSWYSFNDDRVNCIIPTSDLNEGDAYILFYSLRVKNNIVPTTSSSATQGKSNIVRRQTEEEVVEVEDVNDNNDNDGSKRNVCDIDVSNIVTGKRVNNIKSNSNSDDNDNNNFDDDTDDSYSENDNNSDNNSYNDDDNSYNDDDDYGNNSNNDNKPARASSSANARKQKPSRTTTKSKPSNATTKSKTQTMKDDSSDGNSRDGNSRDGHSSDGNISDSSSDDMNKTEYRI